MGKLTTTTTTSSIHHCTHPHLLHLSNLQPSTSLLPPCSGCNFQLSPGHVYTCRPCNFFLHISCSKFPELITHPSHPNHTLTLLSTALYPSGFFQCDACGKQGNRFSYHCGFCDFDLHAVCAAKPISITNPYHVHPLGLVFSSPYGEKVGFSCDLCRQEGSSQQWLYRCVSCEFDSHLECAIAMPQPPPSLPLLQHHHSFPGADDHNHFANQVVAAPLLAHSMSTGNVQSYLPPQFPPTTPGAFQHYHPPQLPPAASGVQSYQLQQSPTVAGAQSCGPPRLPPAAGGVQSYQLQPPAVAGAESYGPPRLPPAAGGVQSYQLQQPAVAVAQSYGPPQLPPAAGGVQSYQLQPSVAGAQSYGPPPSPPVATTNAGSGNGFGEAMVMAFAEGMMQQAGQDFLQSLTDADGGGGGSSDL